MGMGGAFIAVADDATAASWNPGGLIQLEAPEVTIVGEGTYRVEHNTLGEHPEGSGAQRAKQASLNFLALTYPFQLLAHDMVVSLSYQHLYAFNRNWKWGLNFEDPKTGVNYRYQQDGGLYAWSAAYCAQLLSNLSLGFTLNLWEDGIYNNGWQEKLSYTARIQGFGVQRYSRTDEYNFRGFNANVGILWSATDRLTFGVVFKTPFTGDLAHSSVISYTGNTQSERRTTNEDLSMPMSYGLGIAYQPIEHLTLSADVYRTRWQDFILTGPGGSRESGINGLPVESAGIQPTTQVRLGAEYLVVKARYTVPLRAGLFYDPAPAEGSPDPYYGVSIGSGIGIGPFILDLAYQYRFGRNVTSALYRGMNFSQDVGEHAVTSSVIVHF
jgi:long-subunit fatty acid transport protein